MISDFLPTEFCSVPYFIMFSSLQSVSMLYGPKGFCSGVSSAIILTIDIGTWAYKMEDTKLGGVQGTGSQFEMEKLPYFKTVKFAEGQ